MTYIPKKPMMPPNTARYMLMGKLLGNPTHTNRSCATSVIMMLDEPMVAVRDAPILLRPVEYDNDPINGSNENTIKITTTITSCWLFSILEASMDVPPVEKCCISSSNTPTIINPIRMNPDISIEEAATSIDECLDTSFVRNRTPSANPNAESMASKSPKVILNASGIADVFDTLPKSIFSLSPLMPESLMTAKMNPNNASPIPMKCITFNISLKKALARRTIITISSGPAIRSSFEAPILLMESYHVNMPIDKNRDANKRFFQDLMKRIVTPILFLRTMSVTNSSITPPKVILIADSRIGEICIVE